MWFLDQIVTWLNSAAGYFYDACSTVTNWVWPFYNLSPPLYWLYVAFFYLAQYFGEFNSWIDFAALKIAQMINYYDVSAYFKEWFDAGANAWRWVTNAVYNVWQIADTWWAGIAPTVQGWIASATEGLASLRGMWDNFTSTTLPNLVSFTWLINWWNGKLLDVQGLITSAFATRDSLWAGWQDYRIQVAGFFADPEKFLVDKIESMLARFW